MAPPGNESTRLKCTPGTPSKGRRKLSFDNKPLSGKSFYLNFKCSFKEIGTIETDIKELGGIVESFLSKSVSYVVIDRHVTKETSTTSSSPTANPDWSPKTSPSPSSETPSYSSMTRGKLLLQKAVHSRCQGSTDVLSNAKAWGVKIVTLDVLKSWISIAKKAKITVLRGAYIKVEDDDCLYRPSFRQFVKKRWPSLSITKQKHRRRSHRRCVDREDVSKTAPGTEIHDDSRQEGYCECCQVRYNDLNMHVQTPSHQKYAKREDNYMAVDAITNDMPDVGEFISQFAPVSSPTSMDFDDVVLLSPVAKRRCVKHSPQVKNDGSEVHLPQNSNPGSITYHDNTHRGATHNLSNTNPMDQGSGSEDEEPENEDLGFDDCVAQVMERLQTWDALEDDSDDFNTPLNCHEWGNVFDVEVNPDLATELQNTHISDGLFDLKNVYVIDDIISDNQVPNASIMPGTSKNYQKNYAFEEQTHTLQNETERSTTKVDPTTSHKAESREQLNHTVSMDTDSVQNITDTKPTPSLTPNENVPSVTDEYSSLEPVPCMNLLPVFVGLTERIKMNKRSCRKDSTQAEPPKADLRIQECSVLLKKLSKSKTRNTDTRKKSQHCLSV
ncbi:uncharacterized protein LOC144436987 [Glandiceps talaboti]